jgi:signal peptidase I
MTDSPEPRRSRAHGFVRELVVLATFALVALSARSSLASHYAVPTGSMQPTVEIDDRIVVSKAAYGLRVPFTDRYAVRFDGPALGDVVVLDSPIEDKVLLKRVVGTPGATVEVRGGRIVIDGEVAPVEERADGLYERLGHMVHPLRITHGGGPDWGPITIPADRYLVVGDNRGDSADGRSFGLVDREAIHGRALGVYWRGGLHWKDL